MKKLIAIFSVIIAMLLFAVSASAEEVGGEEPTVPTEEVEEVEEKTKSELPEDLVDKIVELIEAWEATAKEDATFADRINEFFTVENLPETVSMLFMCIVGIAVFIMKNKQSISIASTNADLIALRKKLDEQSDTAEKIDKITTFLESVERNITEKEDSAEQAKMVCVGVATMLRDIFQNSRTIDEAGKKMMNLDYLKAIGESLDEAQKEDKKEV